MRQLVGNITDYEMWPKVCVRDGLFIKDNGKTNKWGDKTVDGFGCIQESYHNLSQALSLKNYDGLPQSEMDYDVKSHAPFIVANKEARMTLDKHFSEDNPFSQYSLSQLRVSIKKMKTKLV